MVLALDRAFRRDVCFVCAGTAALLPVPPGDVAICAPCVQLVARALRAASRSVIAEWFTEPEPARSDDADPMPQFLLKFEQSAAGDDAVALHDLALALAEMGCVVDSVRYTARAIALAPALRERALPLLLPAGRRKAGCLTAIAAAARLASGDGANHSSPNVPEDRWLPFECDGVAFDARAIPTRSKTRLAGEPSHRPSRAKSVPGVMLLLRAASGEELPGTFFEGQGRQVTLRDAEEAVRRHRSRP